MKKTLRLAVFAAMAATFSSCEFVEKVLENGNGTKIPVQAMLKNHSVTPALVKKMPGFDNLQVYSLISSDDKLPQSPDFVFGGSADGSGWLKDHEGNIEAVVNHEDNFAVSRLTLDPKTLKPLKGEYILNSDGGLWRLCSATLATPEVHGFGPAYLTCGESGKESRTHAINPLEKALAPSISREVPALGRLSAENAVPLPKDAFVGKTVIIIGDDDSGTDGGQVFMYVGNVGDLQNGDFYMLKRSDDNQRERDMVTGKSYEVQFVKVENHTKLTGAEIGAKVDAMKALKFGRVEDIDFRKGGRSFSRELYFNVTGQATTGANADYSRTKYGRVYKLVMDAKDFTKGKLEVVLDGDDRQGKAGKFQNPDNITLTQNYAYIQEDPNGYGDETHDSYIYQYNLMSGELKVMFELDHRRDAKDSQVYNTEGPSELGDWEYGSMEDISELINTPNTFAICIQPHTWRGPKYAGVDGGTKRKTENQASQIIIVKGISR